MKLRAVLRIAGLTIFVVLAVALLALGGLWTFVQTDLGGDLLRRMAISRIDARIAGDLDVERLRFGGDRLTLDGVVLRDPEGAVVVRVGRIDLAFAPWALLRRHVDVRRLELRQPEVRIATDRRGTNLGRALAPVRRANTPPAPKTEPSAATTGGPHLLVDLRAFAVSGGTFALRGAGPEIELEEIDVDGAAHLDGRAELLRGELRLAANGARASASGAIDLRRMRGGPGGLRGQLRELDAARLVRDAPATNLALDVALHDRRWEGEVRGRLPGATLNGSGALDDRGVDARLRIAASDLAAVAHALARLELAPRLPVAGQASVDVELEGPLGRPSLRVACRAPRLALGHDVVRDLEVRATVPRLDAPEAADADLSARAARIGGQDLRTIAATVRASGAHLEATLRTASPYPVVVVASGQRLSRRTIELRALSARTPEAAWVLSHPARIAFGGSRLTISGFEARAGDQLVRLDLQKMGPAAHLQLVVARLDLGRLPRPLVPRPLAGAGTIDLDVDLELSPARLRGRVTARGLGTGVAATLDLPTRLPSRGLGTTAPLRLDLATEETDLGELARAWGALTRTKPAIDLQGKARLALKLDGSGRHPRVDVALDGRALKVDGRSLGELTLALEGEDDRPLTLRIAATNRGAAPAQIEARTPLSLRALLRRRPDLETLARTPFEIDGHLERMPLAPLGQMLGLSIAVGGTLSAHLSARGTARDPTGTLALDLSGVTSQRFPATDGRVEIAADRRSLRANVRIVRRGHPLLALTSELGASPATLRDRARLESAPIAVRAVLGPLAMRRLGLPANLTGGGLEPALRGQLHADLALDGTLHAPRLLAHIQAGDLRLDDRPVGYGRIEARYERGRGSVEMQVASANGGTLTMVAGVTADLGMPELLERKVDPTRWPFDLRLEAQKLDLRGLSGVTTSVERVAGLFDAHVTAHGTARDPHFSGRVGCAGCELQVSGVGDFRELHLALEGDNDKIILQELAAKAGDGNARVTASLSRHGASGYALAGTVAVKEIPVYHQGQPLAHVSLDAALSGNLGGRGETGEADVEIREAHLTLSDEKRRTLQPLSTPDDVVIVEGGHPVDRAQAAKLRALRSRAGGQALPGEASAEPPTAPKRTAVGFWKRLAVRIKAPGKLWVTGGGARLELGLSPEFELVATDEIRLRGEVIARRGRVDVLGRRFDVKSDSSLRFDGAPDHPTLDATAQFQSNDQGVIVVVTAQGPIDQLKISVSSSNHPELNESQLYALIISGRLPTATTSGGSTASTVSNEATSLIAGVIAGQLQKTLARHLPLDVFTIDTAGDQGLTGTQIEAGRYVTERLYVGYVGRVNADPTRFQNRNAAHLEYQLTARWQIAAEYGDVGTGSADLMWKKSY